MEEDAEGGVVASGVEVLEAGICVVAFADEAFGFGLGAEGGVAGADFAEGFVGLVADLGPGGVGDRADGAELVAVEG